MGNMLDEIASVARSRGFTADVVGTENEVTQTLSIHNTYSNPANVFTFFYPNINTVIEKGKQFAKAQYDERVQDIVRQVTDEIEEGEHESVEDVNSSIEGFVSVYDNADALLILNSTDSLDYITGNPKTGEGLTDIAWRAMVRDITESMGDIQELINDSVNITDTDRDEIFGMVADAVSYAVRNGEDFSVNSIIEEYTDKEKKQEQLGDYIREKASRILREAADRW
jgi:nucleoid DNA-binding protein